MPVIAKKIWEKVELKKTLVQLAIPVGAYEAMNETKITGGEVIVSEGDEVCVLLFKSQTHSKTLYL